MINTLFIVADNCFFGKGEHYRGIVNTTESNLPCETWSNSLEGSQNVDLFGHNYCRNIDSAYDRPWCHVRNDRKSEVQYCDVPRCGKFYFQAESGKYINKFVSLFISFSGKTTQF